MNENVLLEVLIWFYETNLLQPKDYIYLEIL